jgi:hypothetical protein
MLTSRKEILTKARERRQEKREGNQTMRRGIRKAMRQSQPGSLVSVQRTMGYAPCAGEAINAVMRERLTGARSLIKA